MLLDDVVLKLLPEIITVDPTVPLTGEKEDIVGFCPKTFFSENKTKKKQKVKQASFSLCIKIRFAVNVLLRCIK